MENSVKSHKKLRIVFKIMIVIVLLAVLTAGGLWVHRVFKSYYAEDIFKSLDLSQVDKLMIVAHPDDETIWGGGHLSEGRYLVVCITDGYNETRKGEFETAVKHLNNTNIPVILDFPDKMLGKRDSWFGIKGRIGDAVEKCIKLKDWELIVTHNKEGEYGHIHHKMTSSIVKDKYKDLEIANPLYFFGTYYSKKKLPKYEDSLTSMSDEWYSVKVEALKDYTSQKKVVDGLFHMSKYEMWTEYTE